MNSSPGRVGRWNKLSKESRAKSNTLQALSKESRFQNQVSNPWRRKLKELFRTLKTKLTKFPDQTWRPWRIRSRAHFLTSKIKSMACSKIRILMAKMEITPLKTNHKIRRESSIEDSQASETKSEGSGPHEWSVLQLWIYNFLSLDYYINQSHEIKYNFPINYSYLRTNNEPTRKSLCLGKQLRSIQFNLREGFRSEVNKQTISPNSESLQRLKSPTW